MSTMPPVRSPLPAYITFFVPRVLSLYYAGIAILVMVVFLMLVPTSSRLSLASVVFVPPIVAAWLLCYGIFQLRTWSYWVTFLLHGGYVVYHGLRWMLSQQALFLFDGIVTYSELFSCICFTVLIYMMLPPVRTAFRSYS